MPEALRWARSTCVKQPDVYCTYENTRNDHPAARERVGEKKREKNPEDRRVAPSVLVIISLASWTLDLAITKAVIS